MFLKFKFVIFLILLSTELIYTQSIPQSDTTIKPNSTNFLTNYNKVLNLHTFVFLTQADYEMGKLNLKLNNRFNSNIILSTTKNIRDEDYFDFSGGYKLNKLFQPAILIESKSINDNRQVGISRFKDFSTRLMIKSNPISSFTFSPFLGNKQETQLEIKESGKTYGLETTFEEFVTTSKFSGNFKLINDKLDYRFNQLINTDITIENNFSEFLLTSTKFYFNKVGRDFFTQIDSLTAKQFNVNFNIENRLDNIIDFTQRFELRNNLNFNAIIVGNVYYRTVEKNIKYKNLTSPSKNIFDTKINEFKLGLNGELNLELNSVYNSFKFFYMERSEKHSVKRISEIPLFLYYQRLDEELQKNNFSTRITLATQNKLNIISKDTLSLDASISKLKYDTPSLDNFINPATIIRDDRDELLYIIRLQYKKVFKPEFYSSITLESFNNHIVYIFKERSSNNNWNRVLRLTTVTQYESKKFKTKNQFEVLANYTIYDFEDLFQATQSFAFRQFGFQDSTKISLSKNYYLSINYNLKLSEQGILYWRSFSSVPGRFLNEQAGELKLGYDLSESSFVLLGARFTTLSEFNFKGKLKQVVFEMKSLGPLIESYLFYKKDFYLNFKCWIEFIQQTKQQLRRNINLSFNSFLNF